MQYGNSFLFIWLTSYLENEFSVSEYKLFYFFFLFFTEGKGSLHFFLKAKGWATSISAGVGDEGMHRSLIAYIFSMSIHLTDSGLQKVTTYFLLL